MDGPICKICQSVRSLDWSCLRVCLEHLATKNKARHKVDQAIAIESLYVLDMRKILITLLISVLTFINAPSSFAAAKAGANCTKVGATEVVGSLKFTCIKSGSKLTWNKGTKVATSLKETVNQFNAKRKAASYLSISPFSRSGLIEQLEYEGFNNSDATYGVDAQKADWNAQAVKAAKNYLKLTAFSRSDLIAQLEYEGYTNAEATFGVNATGLK